MLRFKKVSDSLFMVSVILFGLYPLLPERYESYIPILLITFSLLIFLKTKQKKINYKPFLIMSMMFIFFGLSAMLSENTALGFKKIETMASLIGMPIVFFIFLSNNKINYKKLQSLFSYIFFFTNVVFSLIAFYLLNYYRNPKFSTKDSDFFRNAITDIPFIGDHSIYISLFLAIAVIMGVYFFLHRKWNNTMKVLISIGLLIITTMLFLLMSKGVLIGLFVSLIGPYIFKKKYRKKATALAMVIVVLVIILIPKQNNRFIELISKQSFEEVDLNNSTSIRFFILRSALNLCVKNPITGYGLGDVQGVLDEEYRANNLSLPNGKYNSHNQYLFVWLSGGLIGLFIFIFYLYFIIKIAVNKNDYFLISISTLYLVTFLFENVLSRQSGVILFAFLINFLVAKNILSDNKINNNHLSTP
ncbi:O-antigen ligase family protein [Winogradskyella sp. R77965]|uniref:O-antigen ligase family protein n=1 Tax=Winogradskyella sp. R77965 TaxID=3093872 RepID=UPI0037DC7D87